MSTTQSNSHINCYSACPWPPLFHSCFTPCNRRNTLSRWLQTEGFFWTFEELILLVVSSSKSHTFLTDHQDPTNLNKLFSASSQAHLFSDRWQMHFATPAKPIYFNTKSACSWWTAIRQVRTMRPFRGWWSPESYEGLESQERVWRGQELGDKMRKESARPTGLRLLLEESKSKET